MTGLERFMEAKRQEVEELERQGTENLRPWSGERPSFPARLPGAARGLLP